MMDIAEYVEETRGRIVAEAEGDSHEDYVYGKGRTATRLAFALVELGEVPEAKQWFTELAPLWIEGADFAIEFRLEEHQEHASSLPVNKWFRGLASAVMTGEDRIWKETAREIHGQITAPRIQDLDGIEHAGRLSAYAALSGLGTGADLEPLLEATRRRATRESESEHPYSWNGIGLNGPQADVLAGIDESDESKVVGGIDGLLDFHEEYRVENREVNGVEREIDFHATMYVALARQKGLDLRLDSEYVPDAVFDDEHYPVGVWAE